MKFITREIFLTLLLLTNIPSSWASDQEDNSYERRNTSISSLPEELIVKIMQEVALDDLVVFRGVNQAWRRIATGQLNNIRTIGSDLYLEAGFDRRKQGDVYEDTAYDYYGDDDQYEAELYKKRYARNLACILKYTLNLENLDLHHLRIGIKEEDEDGVTFSDGEEWSYLVPALMNLTNLQSLNLSGNSIIVQRRNRNTGLELVSALNRLINLNSLNLANMHIGRNKAEEVLATFRNMPNLRQLNLARNKIGYEGVDYLATRILPSLTELETLNLSYTAPTYIEDISYENDCIREYEYNPGALKSLVKSLATLQNFKELNIRQAKDASIKRKGKTIIRKAFPERGRVNVIL